MPYIRRDTARGLPKMAITLLITAKGQITLRKELLRHLGVAAGDKVAVDFLPDGRAELRAAKPEGSIRKFIGSLRQISRIDQDRKIRTAALFVVVVQSRIGAGLKVGGGCRGEVAACREAEDTQPFRI